MGRTCQRDVTVLRIVQSTTQQSYYRNGQLRETVSVRRNLRHGVSHTWHKNGCRATEEHYANGLLHGVCRQWSESGRLLGEYRMVHGTGKQREWHDNGKLQIEVSTVQGAFCGRTRIWLRDGSLLSERFYLHGKTVSAEEYRKAAVTDISLREFTGKPGKSLPHTRATQKRIHKLFVQSLLDKPHGADAREWLAKPAGDKTKRLLGRFKRESDAVKFIEALYRDGAVGVITPDIYRNKAGDQFADGLLVKLSKSTPRRKAVRKVCAQLRTRRLGAMEPEKDIGETHLYLSLL
jgi:hypothetical protein